MEINHREQPITNVGFKGYQHKKSDSGKSLHNFNFVYDYDNWNCEVEFFKVKKDPSNYTYSVVKDKDGGMTAFKTRQLKPGKGVDVDFQNDFRLSINDKYIAYRYKLTPKDPNSKESPKYAKDDDNLICGDGCNLISTISTTPTHQGSMMLIFPDSYKPGYVYAGFHSDNTGSIIKDPNKKDLSNFNRTFSNKAGGTIAGLQADIPKWKAMNISSIITTPITGGDNRSAHYYWIKRMFQPASNLGNINDYDYFQTDLYRNGIRYISDSAYTSQGLEGVNFAYARRWMNPEDEPHEFYMFRMQGIENAALGMGVVPKNMENLRHKLVNAPFKCVQDSNGVVHTQKNDEYKANQPTFIQVYDDSMVSEEQKNSNELIDNYEFVTPKTVLSDGRIVDNPLAINTHDDTVMDNAFQIDPQEYKVNIDTLNEINKYRSASDKIKLNSPEGTLLIGKFSTIDIRPKDEGGFVTWNSNTDMSKLSYTESDYDTQMLDRIKNPRERQIEEDKIKRAHAGNRDMLVDCVRYWTKHQRDLQNMYTARTLGDLGKSPEEAMRRINSLIYNRDDQQLPDQTALNDKEVKTIFSNDYTLRPREADTSKAIDKAIMSVPLDSIEFADDTVGALSSPYISKRSPDLDHVGISRYDAMLDGDFEVPNKYAGTYNKMNKIFTEDIHNFALNVLCDLDKASDEPIFNADQSRLTEYGQYVVPLIAGDIVKYAVIKSLVPDAEMKVLKDEESKDGKTPIPRAGTIVYDYKKLEKEATLKHIGIYGDSPKDEANQILNKMKKGISRLDREDVRKLSSAFQQRLKGTNALSFRFAEVMVDKSGLALGHRIDAAKDMADIDAVVNMDDSCDNQYDEVINIYKPVVQAIKDESPTSLVLAEFTDLYDTMAATYGKNTSGDRKGAIIDDNLRKGQSHFNPEVLGRTLILESGMNTEANYDFFFTAGLNTFGKDFVNKNAFDQNNQNGTEAERVSLLSTALDRFSKMPLDYKRNSYTFGGNHDKPRMTECFGLDMALFHCNLNDRTTKEELNHRKTAYLIMNDLMDSDLIINEADEDAVKQAKQKHWDIIDGKESPDYFNNVSPMAIAKANWLRSSIGIANNIIKNERLKNASDDKARQEIENDSNKIYAAYSHAVRDVVNGDFYLNGENKNSNKKIADAYKKILEKDGFGAKDVLTAFNVLTMQAEDKYDLKNTYLIDKVAKKDFNNLVEKIMIGIPAAKTRLYTQMINALPGNPTVYAGDDYAMTGYEEKNHNVYLGDRNVIPHNVVEEFISSVDENGNEIKVKNPDYKSYIASHKKIMDGILSTRGRDIEDKLAPLSEGTTFVLNDLCAEHERLDDNKQVVGRERDMKCPIILSQSANGSMVISVFNYNGINLENPLTSGANINTREDLDKAIKVQPKSVKPFFNIAVKENGKVEYKEKSVIPIQGRSGKTYVNLDLPVGLKFKNIDDSDKSYYETRMDEAKQCYLVRVFEDKNGNKDDSQGIWIGPETAPEGVLRLYYQPDDVKKAIADKKALVKEYTPSFKGAKKLYYNPQYNIAVSNPYQQAIQSENGTNLSLVSR